MRQIAVKILRKKLFVDGKLNMKDEFMVVAAYDEDIYFEGTFKECKKKVKESNSMMLVS